MSVVILCKFFLTIFERHLITILLRLESSDFVYFTSQIEILKAIVLKTFKYLFFNNQSRLISTKARRNIIFTFLKTNLSCILIYTNFKMIMILSEADDRRHCTVGKDGGFGSLWVVQRK